MRICSVDGCSKRTVGRGWCRKHYSRWYKGNPVVMPLLRERTIERLEKNSTPEPNSGCWLWLGVIGGAGYGRIKYKGQPWIVHRLAWTVHKGTIPEGAMVCHKCDVRSCINPDHLYIGDQETNMSDMVQRSRQAFGERHGFAILDENQIEKIKCDNRPDRIIAEELGVARSTIQAAKTGRTWKHLCEVVK